jgi:hypothetical protein
MKAGWSWWPRWHANWEKLNSSYCIMVGLSRSTHKVNTKCLQSCPKTTGTEVDSSWHALQGVMYCTGGILFCWWTVLFHNMKLLCIDSLKSCIKDLWYIAFKNASPSGRVALIVCTLRSWVRIPLKAWMFVLVFLCWVVLCRQRPFRRTDHSSKEVPSG